MARLLPVVGIHALDGWHDHPRAVLGAGLVGVLLPHAGPVMVGHDHDVLHGSMCLAQGANHRHDVARAVRDHAGSMSSLMDRCRSRKTLGHIQGARLIERAYHP